MKHVFFVYLSLIIGTMAGQINSGQQPKSSIFVSEDAFENEDDLYKPEKIDTRVYETREPENTQEEENTDLRDEGYDANSSQEGAAAYQRDFISKQAQQANEQAKITLIKLANDIQYNESKIATAKAKLEAKKSKLSEKSYASRQLKINAAEAKLGELKTHYKTLKTKQAAMNTKLGN